MSGFLSQPIRAIALALRDGQAGARDLAEAAIARHARFGTLLNAYSLWTPEKARKSADAADAAFATRACAGPLQGIPISIKDLFAAEGLPTFAGSRPAPAADLGKRRAAGGEPAPPARRADGQDAYGRVCLRRHQPQQPLG